MLNIVKKVYISDIMFYICTRNKNKIYKLKIMKQSLWDRLDPTIKSEIEKKCKNHYLATKIKNKLTSLAYFGNLTWGEIVDINLYGNTRKILTPNELFKN